MSELREGLAKALFAHEHDLTTKEWAHLLDGEKAYWFEKAECAIADLRERLEAARQLACNNATGAADAVRECIDLREQLAKAEAGSASMREALIWTQKQVELARIWGGMAWHWNPLLPIFTSAIHERITHELAELAKEQSNG